MEWSERVKHAAENVLDDGRWRYCTNFTMTRWGHRRIATGDCPLRNPEYGCIGCTKFKAIPAFSPLIPTR